MNTVLGSSAFEIATASVIRHRVALPVVAVVMTVWPAVK